MFKKEKNIIEINKRTYRVVADAWQASINRNYNFDIHKKCRDIFINEIKGNNILEIGCGLGYDSLSFYREGYNIYASDIQFNMISKLKKEEPEINATVMDMCNFCFRENFFNGVYSFAAFLHIPKSFSESIINSIYRSLKKDGTFFLYHVKSIYGFESYQVENVLNSGVNLHCYCHTEEEIKKLLLGSGFKQIRIKNVEHDDKKINMVKEKYGLKNYYIISKK